MPESGELRFDMADAEFTHEEDRCSFETLVLRAGLDDPALTAIGELIHELDIADGKFDRPETPGLGAMLNGICASSEDDHERIARGKIGRAQAELQSLMRITSAVFRLKK